VKKRTRRVNLKSVAEAAAKQMRPLVKDLVQIEHDAAGIAKQWERAGFNTEGVDEILQPLQSNVDKRYASAVGTDSDDVRPEEVRALLDLLGKFFGRFGVALDTARLPQDFVVWVDRPEFRDDLPRPDGNRRTIPRYEIVGVASKDLRPDGSLRHPLPEPVEDED